jgi:CRISPR-associated protein Csx10
MGSKSGSVSKTLLLRVEALSPIYLGASKYYEQFRETEAILHGGRLLALAAQELGYGPGGGEGARLLTEALGERVSVRFLDAPPVTRLWLGQSFALRPLPLTAETCKAKPGFCSSSKPSSEEEPAHGVWDTLLRRWSEAPDCLIFLADNVQPSDSCPRCGSKPEEYGGYTYYAPNHHDDLEKCWVYNSLEYWKEEVGLKGCKEIKGACTDWYKRLEAVRERRGHTAISRARGAAQVGMIFSNELIAAGTKFLAPVLIRGPEQEVQKAAQMLTDALVGKEHWLGGGRSRGLGRVRIKVAEGAQLWEFDLAKRVRRFNELLDGGDRIYFTVTLHSRCLPPLRYGLPYASKEQLKEDLFPTLRDYRLEFFLHRFEQISGWSTLWQLPKPVSVAIAAGSVYVFSSAEPIEGGAILMERLRALEEEGIGERREEGFGRVQVCDPFHLEVKVI